jgi:glutaryl-CoA dehydrogenase (non-decarboxylating)
VGRTPRSADDALVGLLFVFRTTGPGGPARTGRPPHSYRSIFVTHYTNCLATNATYEKDFGEFIRRNLCRQANRFDEAEAIPNATIRAIGEAGFFGLTLPASYGGLGESMVSYGRLHRQIGSACSSVRAIVGSHTMTAHALHRWGGRELSAEILPDLASGRRIVAFCLTEANAGSDAQGIQAKAAEARGGYRITGRKKWVTSGQIAGLYLVFAKLQERVVAFLVDRKTPGLRIEPIRGMLGLRAAMLADVTFDNCFVPSSRALAGPDFGLSPILNSALDLGRYSVACGCVGISDACLEAIRNRARTRHQFEVSIGEHQSVQKMISEAAVGARAAWLMCVHAGELRDAGEPGSITATSMAKYLASKTAAAIATSAVQIYGAEGCSKGSLAGRFFRDAKIMEIIEGTSQILETLIAGADD